MISNQKDKKEKEQSDTISEGRRQKEWEKKQEDEKDLNEKDLKEEEQKNQKSEKNLREEKQKNQKDKSELEKEEEYEIVEIEIFPEKIICPDCGGITLEGLDFCDKCGGELF